MKSSVRWTSSSGRSFPNSNLRESATEQLTVLGVGHARDNERYQQMLTELREIAESFAKIVAALKN